MSWASNTQTILEIALENCSMITMEVLLDHLQEVPLTRTVTMILLERAMYQSLNYSMQVQNRLLLKGENFFVGFLGIDVGAEALA